MSKNNGKPTINEVLFQELDHLEMRLSELQAGFNRLERITKYDDKKAAVDESKTRTGLMRAFERNTEVVSDFVELQRQGIKDPLDMSYFRKQKWKRRNQIWRRTEFIRNLSKMRQKITEKCPCGKHKGIQFIDGDGNTVQEACPVDWWVSMSRLAYTDGRLSDFINSNPMDKYLGAYKPG